MIDPNSVESTEFSRALEFISSDRRSLAVLQSCYKNYLLSHIDNIFDKSSCIDDSLLECQQFLLPHLNVPSIISVHKVDIKFRIFAAVSENRQWNHFVGNLVEKQYHHGLICLCSFDLFEKIRDPIMNVFYKKIDEIVNVGVEDLTLISGELRTKYELEIQKLLFDLGVPQGKNIAKIFIFAFVLEMDAKLRLYLSKKWMDLRISQLFDLIVDFPESKPVFEDLKTFEEPFYAQFFDSVLKELGSQLSNRLLHVGANTQDILTQYISTINALRIIDPSGVLSDQVTEATRRYLREEREDSVKCIVNNLMNEETDLYQELKKGGVIDADIEESYENWFPDPCDALAVTSSRRERTTDIITMLVKIFESPDIFIKEYQGILAEKLLSSDVDFDKEVQTLELLKHKFGESALQMCQVMIKDVQDSKRLNQDDALRADKFKFLDVIVLSKLFWPTFRFEDIPLPSEIENAAKNFESHFGTIKAERHLKWIPQLGTVDLEIELADRSESFSVSPVHAAIILRFQNQNKWTVEDLEKETGIPLIQQKIQFWVSKGILHEYGHNCFTVNETKTHAEVIFEDEETSLLPTAIEEKAAEMNVYWSFIVGMLTNLGSLPIDRVHMMLGMFMQQRYDISMEQLGEYLNTLVVDQKLDYSNGLYSLKK